MKLTKYEHACFTVEKNNQSLVIDPGAWSKDFVVPKNVVGIIITHQHPDHFDTEQIRHIVTLNPDAVVIAHSSVTSQLVDTTTIAAAASASLELGPFSLAFFGGEHALIHPDIPIIHNLGVLINNTLYYPGDSLVNPGVPVDTLALPISAPWLRFEQIVDFARNLAPRIAFATHDAILSDTGKTLLDTMLVAQLNGISYQRIDSPIDL